jgi:hypothetical protein
LLNSSNWKTEFLLKIFRKWLFLECLKIGNGSTISVNFDIIGNKSETLSVLGVNRNANITVIYVPLLTENEWIIINYLYAYDMFTLKNEAITWAQTNEVALGGGFENGRADAARHSYWNVIMTKDLSADIAEGASTAHERTNLNEGAFHNTTVMDIENNSIGRSIGSALPSGATRSDCQNAVINALNAGSLTILDDLTNNNANGLGIGLLQPSNQ